MQNNFGMKKKKIRFLLNFFLKILSVPEKVLPLHPQFGTRAF